MVRSPYATRVTKFGSLDARSMDNHKPYTSKDGTYHSFGHGTTDFNPTEKMKRYFHDYQQLALG